MTPERTCDGQLQFPFSQEQNPELICRDISSSSLDSEGISNSLEIVDTGTRDENINWFTTRYNPDLLENLNDYSDETLFRVRQCIEAEHSKNKYINLTEVDDFLLLRDLTPQWHSQSGKSIRYVEGGRKFYEGVNKLIKTQGLDRKQVIDTVFERRRRPRFSNLDDWLKCADENGYRGIKPSVVGESADGARFHEQFRKWVAKNYSDSQKREEISRLMWGDSYKTKKWGIQTIEIGDSLVRFDSESERLIGQLLYKYGLLNEFIEGENFHHVFPREVTGRMGSSVDFILYESDTIIEYHPLSIKDKQRGYLLDEAGEEKIRHLPQEYRNFWYYHIWEVDQLYDILELVRESLPQNTLSSSLQDLSKDQFDIFKKGSKNEAIQQQLEWLEKWNSE